MMTMRNATATLIAACSVVSGAVIGSAAAGGLRQSERPAPPMDLSGMWLVQDPGSGSWTNWFMNAATIGKPSLGPDVIAENKALDELEAKGAVVNKMPRRLDCPAGGVAMFMASSSPLNIVKGASSC